MVGSLIEARLFGLEEDEECDYDHTWIDVTSAHGGDKENQSVGEDNSNMCKDVVIEMDLVQPQVESNLHGDVELQSELQHALDVLIHEHKNVEMPSQFNVKVHCDLCKCRGVQNFQTNQLNRNPTLFKDQFTQTTASIYK